MKKRLLSAALALAMVLTMLPLSALPAFAAVTNPATELTETLCTTDGVFKPVSVTYHAAGYRFQSENTTTGVPEILAPVNGWYYWGKLGGATNNTLYQTESGVIIGSGTSGNWYPNADKALEEGKATSIKVIGGNVSIDLMKAKGTSLTVDVNGVDVALATGSNGTLNNTTTGNPKTTLTSLTINNTAKNSDGSVKNANLSGSISVTDQAFSFTANNTKGSSAPTITLTNNTNTGKTLTVTLNDATVGEIAVVNGAANVKVTGKTKGAAVAGAIKVNESAPANNYDFGTTTINVSGGKTDAITINGKGTITLSDMGEAGAITLNGGKKDATTKAMPKWGGNFTVNVGSQCVTGAIKEADAGTDGVITVNATGGSGSTSGVNSIVMNSATAHVIKVDSNKVGAITLPAGTLTISNGADVGAVTLGASQNGGKITATISGDATTVASVNAADITADSTVTISGGKFTAKSDCVQLPADYAKHTITGGTFGSSIRDKSGWLGSVNYEIKTSEGTAPSTVDSYTYTSSFQDCVNAYKNEADNKAEIVVMGAGSTTFEVSFYLDAPAGTTGGSGSGSGGGTADAPKPIVVIKTDGDHGITLPDKINNKPIDTWYIDDQPYKAGALMKFSKETDVKATTSSADNSSIVKVTAGDTAGGISATLSGNTIKVSGALPANSSGFMDIPLVIETALGNKYNIKVSYAVTEKKLVPGDLSGAPLVAGTDNASIQVKGTSLLYPLDGSGLTIADGGVKEIKLDSCKAEATASVSGGAAEKDALINALKATTADFSDSPAVKEAANKVLAGLSTNAVSNYIRQGKIAAWKEANPGKGNPTESDLNSVSGWDKLEVVLYLNIQASAWNKTVGAQSITLNITPYYRLDVVNSTAGSKAYTVKTGAALPMGGLTSEYGDVTITLAEDLVGNTGLIKDVQWAHHGSYVYKINNKVFITKHGFSPFILNKVDPVAEVTTKDDKGQAVQNYYDSVQTAIDDTVEGDIVKLYTVYNKTAETYSISGKARTITFDPGINGTFTPTFTGAHTTADKTNGNVWKVQLNEDTAVANARVTVGTASNGTATVNVSSARAGSTVTITVNPSNGYRSLAPTVRTNSGAAVSVSGSGNTYTFVVPNGATSITVTPSFVQNTGLPFTDVAANAWYFDGVAYCYNNNLMQGYDGAATTFGINHAVTRAEVVTILWRLAGQPKETPRTTYTDVKSGEWHYDAIAWATNHGYAKGYGDGRFGPNNPVQRQELAVFLHRYAGSPTVSANLGAYSDGQGVADWALAAMRWATSYSILSGTNSVSLNGRLNAYSTAYREQVAVTLQHYHQYYK